MKKIVKSNKKEIINLLIVEDNRLLLDGITEMIDKEPDFKVVAALLECEKMLQKIDESKPDILLLNLGCKCHNSLDFVKSVKEKFPDVKIIMMDLAPSQTDVIDFIQAGVNGFILQSAQISDFHKTIRAVARSETILPPAMAGILFSHIAEHGVNGVDKGKLEQSISLTKRELEVVELITRGMSNKEIANKLCLSHHTIKSNVHNLLKKLALQTRTQIAIYASSINGSKSVTDTISLIDD